MPFERFSRFQSVFEIKTARMPDQAPPARPGLTFRDPYARICLASFTILFLELVLIRWIPAYLRSFGFFTNFVLLASLLGTGIGMLTHRGSRVPIPPLPATLIILIAVTLVSRRSLVVSTTEVLFYNDNATTANEHYG